MWRFPIMISNNEKYFFCVILRFEWKLANELIGARLHWGTFGINSSRRSCLQPCASLHCCRQRSPVWPWQEQRRPQLRTPGEETVLGGTETGDRAVTRAKEWIKTLYCIHIKSSWSSWNRHTVCCNTLLVRCKIENTSGAFHKLEDSIKKLGSTPIFKGTTHYYGIVKVSVWWYPPLLLIYQPLP